jgi:hypothetical protein
VFARHLNEVDWTATGAGIALILSMINVYYLHFRKKQPKFILLNDGDAQDTIPRPYDLLPESIKYQFPKYKCKHPLYATVHLLVANIGDRPGYAKLEAVRPVQSSPATTDPSDAPQAYNYTYSLVPAHSVVDHIIMLRNIPENCDGYEVTVNVELHVGGPRGRIASSLTTTSKNYYTLVRLTPASGTCGELASEAVAARRS